MSFRYWPKLAVGLVVVLALDACGGGGGGGAPSPAPTYSLSANVSGLSGTGLSLALNGGTAISISADGVVALGSNLAAGAQYSVAVSASPQDPSQTCALGNASGTINGSAASVSVTCSTNASQPAVKAALDASLPSALTQMIAQVQTVGGSGPLGSWINSGVTNADGETLVLAVDAAGHPVAAAMTTSFDGTLSADSTALSLVRLLIADVSTTMTAAQINTTIKASSQYPALVAAINTDFQASSLPLSDVNVVTALTAVASAAAAVTVTATPAASLAKVKAAITVGPWTSGNKLTIVSGDLIYLLAAGGSPTAALVNGLPIPWSVTESTAAGIVEGPTTLPKGSLNSLLAPVDLAVQMSNATFTLNLQQSSNTLGSIAGDFEVALLNGFSTVVSKSLQLPKSCANIVPSALQSAVAKAANSSTLQDPLSLAKAAVTPSVLQSVYGQCIPSVTVSLATAAMYASIEQLWVDYASKMSNINGVLSTELTALDLVGEAVAGEIYWQKSYSVKVCTASDWTVHSCVATLSIINPTLYMAPGTSITTASVIAKASDGTLTVLPGDLSPDNSSFLSVTVTGGQITAAAADVVPPPNSVPLTVSDPATGIVSAPDPIFVVLPNLSTPQTTLSPPAVATDVTIKLIDPLGNAIPVPANITWTTTATSGQFLFKSSSAGQSIWTLPAGASPSGSFDVTATDAAGVSYPTLTFTLDAAVGPGTCIPPAGATTCSVTLYSIPYGNYSGFVAPAPGMITTVQTNNGVTTTIVNNQSPLGVTIYDNVNGPPLNTPPCFQNPNNIYGGCPSLHYHNFQLCAVDGKWTPVSYQSVVSFQVALPTGETCMTSIPNASEQDNIVTGYSLSAAGILTGIDTSTASQNMTCQIPYVSGPGSYTGTSRIQNAKHNPISMNLKDGSGNASVSESRQSSSTNTLDPSQNQTSTTSITGTQSWPAESVSPPQFPNTGIGASTTQVPAGQALPQACTVGTP
jgi:hypothetical protein